VPAPAWGAGNNFEVPVKTAQKALESGVGRRHLPRLAFAMALVYATLIVSERMDRFLGNTGRAILTRLLGVLLAALSVQFVVDGIKSAFAF